MRLQADTDITQISLCKNSCRNAHGQGDDDDAQHIGHHVFDDDTHVGAAKSLRSHDVITFLQRERLSSDQSCHSDPACQCKGDDNGRHSRPHDHHD